MKADLILKIHLVNLKRIVSGEKRNEYRDNKAYYHKKWRDLDEDFCTINPPKIIKLEAGYQKDCKYAIIKVEKIRYEQFFGETKPIPEDFKYGDIAYNIYISEVLEHNL
jgi:hypothetical protein